MKKFVVYKHTNKSNGKVYIGITSTKPEKRWNSGRGYKNNRHFNRAIQKYGWDGFEHEILYENLEELQAKTLEISLIRFYDSTNPSKGYNNSTGGEGASGCKRSDEYKKKISEILTGRKASDETRKKMSETLMGHKVSDETRKKMSETKKCHSVSDETRKKMSETKKGHKVSDDTRKKMSETKKGHKVSDDTRKKMSEAKKGRKLKPLSDETRKKLSELKNKQRIICIETGVEYESYMDATRKTGFNLGGIYNSCIKGYTCKGFHFKKLQY